MELKEYINETFNYEKLRKSRKKRKLSINQVAEMTGVPPTTLQKYESGIIKKIPLDALKKICDVYGTDYKYYYGWTSFPLIGTFSGLVMSFLCGITLNNTVMGVSIGYLLGVLGLQGAVKYFEGAEKENKFESLYNQLNDLEKKEYNRFKKIVNLHLNSEEYFTEEELKKEEVYLLAYFFGHKLKKEYNDINGITPYNITEIEVLEKNDNN
ncbi:helix-turn-helix domain-containing protein [uncultured Fusobacterium sp.]|uniref:helix-turn-helix domain-containing protein n=1 Tax=uncultured Fusobacterium sp. TaxID=159267 RepID=UPI0015A683A5|nr:helix-turn-helix domain-containing protein [uncultured Fusobacterium sp.]